MKNTEAEGAPAERVPFPECPECGAHHKPNTHAHHPEGDCYRAAELQDWCSALHASDAGSSDPRPDACALSAYLLRRLGSWRTGSDFTSDYDAAVRRLVEVTIHDHDERCDACKQS